MLNADVGDDASFELVSDDGMLGVAIKEGTYEAVIGLETLDIGEMVVGDGTLDVVDEGTFDTVTGDVILDAIVGDATFDVGKGVEELLSTLVGDVVAGNSLLGPVDVFGWLWSALRVVLEVVLSVLHKIQNT